MSLHSIAIYGYDSAQSLKALYTAESAPERFADFLCPRHSDQVMTGRGRIQHPQGKEVHRLCTAFNLPIALWVRLKAAPKGLQNSHRSRVMSSNTPAIRPHVEIVNGQLVTNSFKIAEHFGKQHKDVLRAIDGLECS